VVSCATCHNPGLSWADGLERAVGHGMKPLARRTPTILNVAWAEALFWDGRAESLEEQALGPIASPDEMNLPLEALVPKLQAIPEYAGRFEEAYPGEGVSPATVARAIASFERTVVSARAPFDAWIEGDEDAIDESAKQGFRLFNGKARCATCHGGWRFTDDSFHDIGVRGPDRGRGAVLEGIDVLQFAFKTPTLRDVDRRAPYMHDGSEKALEDAVALYDMGGRVQRPSLSREIVPLELTDEESRQLVAFLRTLTSEEAPVTIPRLPR
jgi:cytochrome c peroxidase